jgi:hypothetical protein
MPAPCLKLLGLLLGVLLPGSTAQVLNPDRQMSQYAHTAWRVQDGAFSGTPIVGLQTADEYLWIGTNLGRRAA